jgi:hypothetical protein
MNARSVVRWALIFLAGAAWSGMALTQVSKPTAEDLAGRGGGAAGAATPGGGAQVAAAVAAAPSADPQNISGTWSYMNPNRGAGGGPRAGGATGGAGARGAPGAPGAAPGGAPGGGPPAAGGGPPAESGGTRLQCFPSFSSFGGVEGVVDIMQSPRVTVMVGQEMQMVRRIYMSDEHPGNVKPSFYGDSIGRWEGDTLVVDTIGIRTSAGRTRHVVERIRKINNGQNLESVLTEFGADGKPAGNARTSSLYWNPSRKLAEWICEDADEFWDPNYR